MIKPSNKVKNLKQSAIRAASARCSELSGVNLGQGVCDLPVADEIKQSTFDAINADKSMYTACEGIAKLRVKLADKIKNFNGISVDAEKEVMISHGSTGAFVCATMSVFNPGDEVIVFEPFYGYHKKILNLFNIEVKGVAINLADYSIDLAELEQAIGSKTKGIIICTPNNPSGKVYSKEELSAIGDIILKHNLIAITDEIYEYITYPGYEHSSLASLSDELKQQTITISGFSKTYNMTGWRLGYASGPAHIIEKMALVQDLVYVCPASPLQYGVITALDFADDYYEQMRQQYLQKRDDVVAKLQQFGFQVSAPHGAYYIMAGLEGMRFKDDKELSHYLLEEMKVAVVPGSAFYLNPEQGIKQVRFCYAMREESVSKAMNLLSNAKLK